MRPLRTQRTCVCPTCCSTSNEGEQRTVKPPHYVLYQAVELIRELDLPCDVGQPSLSLKSVLRVLHEAARHPNAEAGVRRFVRAEASLLSGRWDAARRSFQEIVGDTTATSRVAGLAWDRLGDLDWWSGRVASAARAYEKALWLRPGDLRTQRDLARARGALGSAAPPEGAFDGDVLQKVDRETVGNAQRPYRRRNVKRVSGLYTSEAGAGVLPIQGRLDPSTQNLAVTGTLGDAAREACELAWDLWQQRESSDGMVGVRVHLPQGGIPKDGPSLGLAVYALIGGLLGALPIRNQVALTGEVDLEGQVWPVGGAPQKMLAAYLAGFERVVLPAANLAEVQDSYKMSLELLPCARVHELEQLL